MLAFALPAAPAETETRNSQAQEAAKQAQKAAAQARYARLAAVLCREADAVMAMVVDVARYNTSRHADVSTIIRERRYYPAAPAEVALKLSRLVRDLRKEAKLWGSPCAP